MKQNNILRSILFVAWLLAAQLGHAQLTYDIDMLRYEHDGDGGAKVTGFAEGKSSNTVSIPSTVTLGSKVCDVTEIAADAFRDNKSIKVFTYPSTLTTIGRRAFMNCSSLYSVNVSGTMPSNGVCRLQAQLTTIGQAAFKGCTSLKQVYMYQKTSGTSYEEDIFAETNLTQATVYGNVPNGMFRACKSLTTCTLSGFGADSSKKISIGDNAFAQCTSLTFPSFQGRVERIGSNAFADCTQYTVLTITCPEIGDFAFKGCTGLDLLTLSVSTRIGYGAFMGCNNLRSTSINALPKYATSMHPCFQECTGKIAIGGLSDNIVGSLKNSDNIFSGSCFTEASVGNYEEGFFTNCPYLEKVTFRNPNWQHFRGEIVVDCPRVKEFAVETSEEGYIVEDGCVYYQSSGITYLLAVAPALSYVKVRADCRSIYSTSGFHGTYDCRALTTVPNCFYGSPQNYPTVLVTSAKYASFCSSVFWNKGNKIVAIDVTDDLNGDGRISVGDLTHLVKMIQK